MAPSPQPLSAPAAPDVNARQLVGQSIEAATAAHALRSRAKVALALCAALLGMAAAS